MAVQTVNWFIINLPPNFLRTLKLLLRRNPPLVQRILVFCAFAIHFLVGNAAFSQGKLALLVTDFETTKPIADAKIELMLNGKVLQSGITNENGKIIIEVSNSQMMDVVISKQGYNKMMICEIEVKGKSLIIGGALTKGSQLQYYTHSYFQKAKKKMQKTSRRAFARF